ncbi:MAG: hypothetical protein H7234_00220 [Herminiimonas sp.]|nr:hypothetical protein [Herminiimonas sp.]
MSCDQEEKPIAWGGKSAESAARRGTGTSVMGDDGISYFQPTTSNASLGGSPRDNPEAHGNVSTSIWPQYTGIADFYDLSEDWRKSQDPRLTFSVRLDRAAASARTSAGTSTITASPRLNNFATNFASGVMSAMATSEVYFERPWFNSGDHSYSTGDTAYIVTQNQSSANATKKTRELGSLFNPYWQVRLTTNDAAQLKNQQALQGAEMPQ